MVVPWFCIERLGYLFEGASWGACPVFGEEQEQAGEGGQKHDIVV